MEKLTRQQNSSGGGSLDSRLRETMAVNQDVSNAGRNRTQHTGTGHREMQTI